jgi:hypothetical protein
MQGAAETCHILAVLLLLLPLLLILVLFVPTGT